MLEKVDINSCNSFSEIWIKSSERGKGSNTKSIYRKKEEKINSILDMVRLNSSEISG